MILSFANAFKEAMIHFVKFQSQSQDVMHYQRPLIVSHKLNVSPFFIPPLGLDELCMDDWQPLLHNGNTPGVCEVAGIRLHGMLQMFPHSIVCGCQ